MKTFFKSLLVAVASILLFTACKKNDETYNAYFFTTKSPDEVKLSLFIDGEYKGELPYLNPKPTCDNDTLKQKALILRLGSGKHDFVAKDDQGNERSTNKVKITKNKTSCSGSNGGSEMTKQNDCLIVNLFY
jgi:hypothetical protein